ncbi:FAD-dependent oxidoreductase [Candidatus Woesearchaeota archaeon]|nr:FAD-dependent oxidoreductase [Candidatus Woesearchaeota archaeon]
MKTPRLRKIAVIGAGIAGLTCAYELQKAGFAVTVYEKENIVGGRMSTRTKKDMPFDIGANHLANVYTEMRKYCNELGVLWQKMSFLQYGIARDGNILPLTAGVSWVSKVLLSLQFLRCGKGIDFFDLSTARAYDHENAYDFMKRKTGKEIADYYVDPFASTYQFHRAKEISVSALLGVMQSIKYHKKDWDLHNTKGGMSALPNALAKQLHVRTATPVTHIHARKKSVELVTNGKTASFEKAVLATTAGITKKIYKNPTREQQKVLDGTPYSSTISVAFRVPSKKMRQFSVVWVPYKESSAISGFTNEKMKGEELIHKDKSMLSVWLHEDFAKKILDKPDKEIFSLVRKEFLKICSWLDEDDLEGYDLHRWPEAMPKFSQEHIRSVSEFLKKGQGENNIYFCGDYLNSPWTEGALRCGQRVAQQIIASYKPTQ